MWAPCVLNIRNTIIFATADQVTTEIDTNYGKQKKHGKIKISG